MDPLNSNAQSDALPYIMLFLLWYGGLSCSDSTVDALITQKSKLEPDEKRGTLLSITRISRQFGALLAIVSVSLLFNTPKYGGKFCSFGIDFNTYTWIPFAFTVFALVYALLFTNEKDLDRKKEKIETRKKLKQLWELFHRWNYLKLLLFALLINIQWAIKVGNGTF